MTLIGLHSAETFSRAPRTGMLSEKCVHSCDYVAVLDNTVGESVTGQLPEGRRWLAINAALHC